MNRFILALRCFLAVLLRSSLPPQAVALLLPVPPPAEKEAPALPSAAPPQEPPLPPAPPAAEPQQAQPARVDSAGSVHRGAVQLLGLLQREGRLLDFLMETIDGYSDAQIGAAVRDIHRGCRKALGEHMRVRAIRPEPDEAVVRIPEGYDPSEIRLVGRVTGRPPFEGTLRHHGWRTGEINLSDIPAGHDPSVICPAEVEIGA